MNDSDLLNTLKTMSQSDRSGNDEWIPQPEILNMVAELLGPTIADALVCAGSALYGAGPATDVSPMISGNDSSTTAQKRSFSPDGETPSTSKRQRLSPSCHPRPVDYVPPPPYRPPTSSPPPPYRPPTSPAYYPEVVELSSDEDDCRIMWSSCTPPNNDVVHRVSPVEPLDLSVKSAQSIITMNNFNDISSDSFEQYGLSDEFGGEYWSDWSDF